MVYLSGAVRTGFDLTPPMFALSSFLMLAAVFRYDFLDINVAAFPQIFAAMEEGVIIYNRRGKVTCRNEAARNYVDVEPGDLCTRVWEKLCLISLERMFAAEESWAERVTGARPAFARSWFTKSATSCM